MANAKATDPAEMVISYPVGISGTEDEQGYGAVKDALAKGYHVLDIISTATGSNTSSFVVVTVLLVRGDDSGKHYYATPRRGGK
jgi:hypothetical protein